MAAPVTGSRPRTDVQFANTAGRSRAFGLVAVSLGFLMITLDATIVNVALGPIGSDLGGALSTAQWIVNGYVLDENVRLFTASRFANQPGYGFYLQILAVGMLPWTALLVGRLVDDVRDVLRGRPLGACGFRKLRPMSWCGEQSGGNRARSMLDTIFWWRRAGTS